MGKDWVFEILFVDLVATKVQIFHNLGVDIRKIRISMHVLNHI